MMRIMNYVYMHYEILNVTDSCQKKPMHWINIFRYHSKLSKMTKYQRLHWQVFTVCVYVVLGSKIIHRHSNYIGLHSLAVAQTRYTAYTEYWTIVMFLYELAACKPFASSCIARLSILIWFPIFLTFSHIHSQQGN